MTKLIIALVALIVSLTAFVASLQLKEPEDVLGGANTVDIYKVASSSAGTYFHGVVAARTATATLLTIDRVFELEKLGLVLTVKNATNSPGTIFMQPEASFDAQEWHTLSNLHTYTSDTGSSVARIDLGNGSTTLLTYTPVSQGTTSIEYVLDPPVARFLRFRVWTSGTSSVLLEGLRY